MNLQERHTELLLKIGFSPNEIKPLWLDLEKAYTAKSRHYHNLKHLEEMIELYAIHNIELKQPTEILYSIFYHDIVYKASRKDNERKSAELALSILPKDAKLDTPLVFDAICATQKHQQHENEDINYLIDFDLKILSKSWEDYQIYSQQIRQEYKIYPNILYYPGRKKALEHFLKQEFIYKTSFFRNKYEHQARLNIETEIKLI